MNNEFDIEFHKPEKAKPVSKKKIIIIITSILAVFLIILLTAVSIWYFSPRQKFIRAIIHSNYQIAVNIQKNKDVQTDEITINILNDNLKTLKNDYSLGKIDYEEAINQISIIKMIGGVGIEPNASDVEEYINSIDFSSKSYKQGLNALESGEYSKAIILFEEVLEIDAENYSSAQYHKDQAIEQYRNELFSTAQVKADNEDFIGAIAVLQNALDVIPEDKLTNAKIKEYRNKVKDQEIEKILSSSSELASQGDLISAINEITPYITKYDNDERLTKGLEEYTNKFVNNIMSQVKDFEDCKDYSGAISLLTKANTDLPSNTTIANKLSEMQKLKDEKDLLERKSQILKEAEDALINQGYEKAISILLSDSTLASDSDIKVKIAEYQTYKPINLFSLDFWDSNNSVTRVEGPYSVKDNLGNEHPSSYQIYDIAWTTYVTYRIDGKYNHLKGLFFLEYDSRSTSCSGTLNVYNDDDSIIYTATLSKGGNPVNFDVDISSINNLKIEYISHTGPMADFPGHEFSLCDVTVSK